MRRNAHHLTDVRRLAAVGLVLALVLALSACEDLGFGTSDTSLTLQLTDHPAGDVQAAWLQVDAVEFQGTSGGVTVMDSPSDWIRVSDLQAEENEFEPLVEGVSVPAGTYSQVRVFLGGAAVLSEDDVLFVSGDAPGSVTALGSNGVQDLTCPSCPQTGIKANIPGGSVTLDGEQTVLAIDFDVSQSFGHQAGMSGMWVMHPVMGLLELEVTGTVQGQVADAVEPTVSFPECGTTDGGTPASRSVGDFEPLAVEAGVSDPATQTGTVNSDGSYAIRLPAGSYEMEFEKEIAFDNGESLVFEATAHQGDPATPLTDPVDVTEGGVVEVDYELDSVTCEPSS